MTGTQKTAYQHPCYHAGETSHPRFGSVHVVEGRQVSIVLTANVGME
jgi:hypothetical protein